jgi:hypothetical protein
MTDTVTVGAFIVLIGALLIPIIPITILKLADSFMGRFLLLLLPLAAFQLYGIELAILVGAVVGLFINRTHDLFAIESSGMMNYVKNSQKLNNNGGIPPQIYNGRVTVVRDLSPNLIKSHKIPDSLILLDPPVKRMERKYNIV